MQMVGREGAAHRINGAAVALHAGLTVAQFYQTDLAYAPPFGPAWDPMLTCAGQLLKKMTAFGGIMKSYRKELWFEVPGGGRSSTSPRRWNSAGESREFEKEGLVLVNAMHITASVFINDDEPGLHHDYDAWLETRAAHARVPIPAQRRRGQRRRSHETQSWAGRWWSP